MVLTLVPASEPFTPALARIASVAERSSMLWLARPATADDIENASDICAIEVLEASAADDNAFAAVSADTLNTFMASDITTAACPTSISPTLANSRAVLPAPPRTVSSFMPAFSNSSMPCVASVGPTPRACDIAIDDALILSISSAVAPVLALMLSSVDSNAAP